VTLGRRVLRMVPGVDVQPRPVFEKDVRRAWVRSDLVEEIPGEKVCAQDGTPRPSAGHAVLALEAKDAASHPSIQRSKPRASPDGSHGLDPPRFCPVERARRRQGGVTATVVAPGPVAKQCPPRL